MPQNHHTKAIFMPFDNAPKLVTKPAFTPVRGNATPFTEMTLRLLTPKAIRGPKWEHVSAYDVLIMRKANAKILVPIQTNVESGVDVDRPSDFCNQTSKTIFSFQQRVLPTNKTTNAYRCICFSHCVRCSYNASENMKSWFHIFLNDPKIES